MGVLWCKCGSGKNTELGKWHPHASLRPIHMVIKEDSAAIHSAFVLCNHMRRIFMPCNNTSESVGATTVCVLFVCSSNPYLLPGRLGTAVQFDKWRG